MCRNEHYTLHQSRHTPDIMVDDEAVLAARAQSGLVPGQRADAGRVPFQGSDLLAPVGVPDLDDRAGGANGNVLAVGRPGHAGHVLILLLALHEGADAPAAGIPQIHPSLQSYCHLQGSGRLEDSILGCFCSL